MRKHFFGFMTMLFAAGFCLASCSKELPVVEEEPVGGYVINIPVQMTSTRAVAEGDGKATATFKTTDNVYIYNRTKNTWDSAVLHPAEADVSETLLTGTLNGTNYVEGHDLTVLYNTSSQGVVDYSAQDGTLDHVVDAGTADVQIKSIVGGDITTGGADIQNLQSIFRFVFKAGNTELSGIRFVRIFSSDNKLQTQYNVISDTPTYGPITISGSTNLENSDHHIYAGLRFTANPGDAIAFQVVTSDGKVYSGSKSAPSAGFVNGKFYTSTVNVNLYTFTVASGKKVYFSPGDLGVEVIDNQFVYSFTEPFTNWGQGITKNYQSYDAVKEVTQRTWFDFYFESGLREGFSLYGITNWRIPTRVGSTVESYEWNYLVCYNNVGRTMNSGVNPYYIVTIPGHQYCLLLPPDEAQSSDIGDDLTSGSVFDYIKYLGKGFVLLFNTNRATYGGRPAKWSWPSSTSSFFNQGFYWTWYNDSNRYYFTWPSAGPKVDWGSNRMRNHIRYVHDVTVE